MPKKNCRGFRFLGSKTKKKLDAEEEKSSGVPEPPTTDDTERKVLPAEERYSSFVQVPVESQPKARTKKLTKKDRKILSDIEKKELNNKKLLVVNVIPDIFWECAHDIETREECLANFVEDALKISKVDVFYGGEKEELDSSPVMSEGEEKSLSEFLRTLEIVDTRIREQKEMYQKCLGQYRKPESDYEVVEFSKGIKVVEPIAEEIFEEYVDEEVKEQDDPPFFRSTSLSPIFKRNGVKIAELKDKSPPKVLYSYNGIPFTPNNRRQAIMVQDIDDGILVINNIRNREREKFTPVRQLDVIMEESSDVSDASSAHSDKKKDATVLDRREHIFDGRGKTFDIQIQPVIKETVKIFPLHKNPELGPKSDLTQVRIQTVVLEKVHPTSIVRIELPEKESDDDDDDGGGGDGGGGDGGGDYYGDNHSTDDVSGVEIVSLTDRTYENFSMFQEDKSSLSLRSITDSYDIKFIDEESEQSMSSGGFNFNEDGGEADVESELDSRRETLLFHNIENDLSLTLDDIMDFDDSPDYGTIKKSPFKDKNCFKSGGATGGDEHGEIAQKVTSSGEEAPEHNFNDFKSSPAFSGRDSGSSVASGATIKKADTNSSQDYKDYQNVELVNGEINLGYISSNQPGEDDFSLESPYKSSKVLEQIHEIEKEVNVKKLAKTMEKDLDMVIKSKLKVYESFEDPVMSEKAWSNFLQTAKSERNLKGSAEEGDGEGIGSGIGNSFSLVKFKHHSNSSSYENVSKSRESGTENENIYEAIIGPQALSDLAEKKVMSLPYGHFLLKKIGLGKCCEDSKDAEDDIYRKANASPLDASDGKSRLTRSQSSSSEVKSRCLPWAKSSSKKVPERNQPSYIQFNCSNPSDGHEAETWYGMRTNNPSLLLGLSPSQKKVYEGQRKRFVPSQEEAANLLDLHKKFLERRSHDEWNPIRRDRNVVYDSNDVIYSEIIPKKKAEAEVGRLSKKLYEKKNTTEEKSVARVNQANADKDGEKSKDVGSCGLLAILQNATSDDSAPELTKPGYRTENTENTQGEPLNATKEKHKNGTGNDGSNQATSDVAKKSADDGEKFPITAARPSISDIVTSFEQSATAEIVKKGNESNSLKNAGIVTGNENWKNSKNGAAAENGSREYSGKKSTLSENELFKQKMYMEYMSKVAERLERRQNKVIKISKANRADGPEEEKSFDLENEFINKAKERRDKLGLKDDSGSEPEFDLIEKSVQEFEDLFKEEFRERDAGKEGLTNAKTKSIQFLLDPTSDLVGLPKHLQEFLVAEGDLTDGSDDLQEVNLKLKLCPNGNKHRKKSLLKEIDEELVLSKGFLFGRGSDMISPTFKATAPRPGVWSPVQTTNSDKKTEEKEGNEERKKLEDEPIPPVWTPRSTQASPVLERKEFRPVNFESPTLPRKKYIQEERSGSVPPPWEQPGGDRLVELVKTPSSPALSLPKAPNPTVTLLQKAREGHIPRGARYLDYNMSAEAVNDDGSLPQTEDKSYSLREDSEASKKSELVAPKKIVGIGPTTKEGIPLVLRSEVTDENKEKWYKRMYDSLHKAGKDEDYVTVKYRTSPSRKGLQSYQPVSSSGYQSEPESIIYDSNRYNKYSTLDRRRSEKSKENDYISVTLPRSRASTPRYGSEPYRNQPGRIEDYEPGHSSISELEARQWWDEVLEIFDRWLERNPGGHGPDSVKLLTDATHRRREEERGGRIHKTQSPKSFMTYALKDSAFLCDPQHVFKRREEEFQSQLSPQEQKEAYRVIQKGGEVPLCGLRKPAPERPKDDRNTQIEYFPLSPTLTRIRVHKQNITPLNPFPFLRFPSTCHQGALGYQNLPFGVCNSFSQVQIFPRYSPVFQPGEKKISADSIPDRGERECKRVTDKNRKFSVQLQNISESKDYVHVVPKPRSQTKKSPIYANIPARPDTIKEEISPRLLSPENQSFERRNPGDKESDTGKIPFYDSKPNKTKESRDLSEIPVQSKLGKKTFFDFKRTAPSIVSKSLFAKKEIKEKPEKKLSSVKKTVSSSPKFRSPDKTPGKTLPPGKENRTKTQIPVKKYKKSFERLPLSQSVQREKPVACTRLTKDSCQKEKVKEEEIERTEEGRSKDLAQNDDSQPEIPCQKENKPEEEEDMSPIYGTSKTNSTYKHKVETNVTEAFRSRSFSPDVRRKIPKPADATTAPSPPKRKQSKNSSTLRMWSKMMVTYPYHRSRLDVYDSNVKFLREKLRRKLDHDDKENETQFGEDIETVRTVKKDKDGSMSIKTNRYVSVPKPFSKDSSIPPRYTYNEHGRRVLSEPREVAAASGSKTRKYDTCYGLDKVGGSIRKTNAKEKGDTVVRSSTTYSVRRPASLEDKRKSVKVTVAVSSKGKEVLRKSASLPSGEKKSVPKSSTSPCPSVSSGRSGLSARSPSDKGSTVSSHCLSPQNRFYSPNSSTGRLSSPSRSASPAYVPLRQETISPPLTIACNANKTKKMLPKKSKDTMIKSPGVKVQVPLSKNGSVKTEIKRKIKKSEKTDIEKKVKKNGVGRQGSRKKEAEKRPQDVRNEVTEHTSLVRTDSFFQNLFLRGQSDKRAYSKLDRTSSVLERARRFQLITDLPREYKIEPSLSLITYYLTQKRPVSLSRFKHLDRELSSSRSLSPCMSRSPSFQVKLRHFDSLSQFGDDDFGSGQLTPNLKGRSSSEPPLISSQMNSTGERIPMKPPSRLSMSETSSLRTSPNSSRSPSCRRIQSFRPGSTIQEIRRKELRARSAGEVEETKKGQMAAGSLTQSTSSLNLSNFSDHAEYQAYVLELMHSKEKCQRFRDLHKFYSSLERMGELERAMSVGDLRPRLKNEEIIDFDRWKLLRTKERAEAELKCLVGKLLKVQKEKDLMFRTADVEAVRWKGDRGLRLKERSVEDLKEQFDKGAEEIVDVDNFQRCIDSGKDVYKPFWRGNSIVNLANNLNATTASYRGRPVTYEELQRIKAAEERLKKKFGLKSFNTRTWSSLSNEQVDSLKTQLSEIFSQELRKKCMETDDIENYEITVPEDNVKTPGEKGLYVRCSSALSKNQLLSSSKDEEAKESKKSGSISALPSWKCDGGEKKVFLELPWKEEIDRGKSGKSRPMTENEKKRLSMTLSKEVLEKLKAPVKTHLLPRETLGAMVVASNALRLPSGPPQETFSPRTCYSLETSEDGKSKNDFLLVLTPTEKGKEMEKVVEEWANGTSDSRKPSRTTSITELESASASSETSVKTVIRNPVDVSKKVEYYEELSQSAEESMILEGSNKGEDRARTPERPRGRQVRSHSLENIKEYFGEQERYNVSSENKLIGEDERMRSEDFHSLRKIFEEDKESYGYGLGGYRNSNDSIFSLRSRSVSPDPTKYYRAYLRMVKCGAVRKLRNKFESWEDLLALSSDKDPWLPPKRYASDPELTRDLLRRYGTDPTKVTIRGQEVGDVRWLRTKYEKDHGNPQRRLRSPISRNPFTPQDRRMPRINVISKTAELQMNRRRSPDGMPTKRLPASPEHYRSLTDYARDHGGGYYYTGEVEKLRRKFEKLHAAERLSILGQMYTSTPDVSELRDIAPYLGCSWAAHRHPELSKASPSPPGIESGGRATKKIQIKPRPHSSSPVRPKQPLSILKTPPQRDIFADQKFDPSIHRPVYRYQPELDHRPKRETADYPQWRQWNKPTVKFKEPVDFFPETQDSSPDSPTKYVESEVTIHYKSPVRSEAKAALSEDELARRQAESMKRIYKEERRRKYLQELQDMNSRRHADNFIPSQKSPIPLNRYDDFPDEPSPRIRDHSTEPVLVARGLYDFVGRRPRELAFRRGDIIFCIKQLDKNWCEGELNGAVGLFPLSYVEIIPYNEYNPKFGRARAKYDFVPQTSLELSARKGEMIALVRKIDENWFEGRIGDRTGIIPASYCQILSLPQIRIPGRSERAASSKPVAAPAAHSLIHNGNAVSSKHYYTPSYGGRGSPGRSSSSPAVREAHAAIDQLIDEALFYLEEDLDRRRAPKPLNLRVNPRPEPALYQVLFNHVPNNDDELELIQGETVVVLEKCGDGWYIGSKTNGRKLGIFPGTHVRRIAPEFV